MTGSFMQKIWGGGNNQPSGNDGQNQQTGDTVKLPDQQIAPPPVNPYIPPAPAQPQNQQRTPEEIQQNQERVLKDWTSNNVKPLELSQEVLSQLQNGDPRGLSEAVQGYIANVSQSLLKAQADMISAGIENARKDILRDAVSGTMKVTSFTDGVGKLTDEFGVIENTSPGLIETTMQGFMRHGMSPEKAYEQAKTHFKNMMASISTHARAGNPTGPSSKKEDWSAFINT